MDFKLTGFWKTVLNHSRVKHVSQIYRAFEKTINQVDLIIYCADNWNSQSIKNITRALAG